MRPKSWTYTPAATTANGYAAGVTGATWTLSATTANDGLAHKTTILNNSATNHSGKTALVTGTDADGNAQTETITLPNGNVTVTGSKYFKTVTSVVPAEFAIAPAVFEAYITSPAVSPDCASSTP